MMGEQYRFDEMDTETSLIIMFKHFKGKKSYDANFKKLQDYILKSGKKKNINWYFDVAIPSKWIDVWGMEEWTKYINVICRYCKLPHKIRLLESLQSFYYASKQDSKTDLGKKMLSYITKLKNSIKLEKQEISKKNKIKAILDSAKHSNLNKDGQDLPKK